MALGALRVEDRTTTTRGPRWFHLGQFDLLARAVGVLLGLLLASACGPGGETERAPLSTAQLHGHLETAAEVLVALGRGFDLSSCGGQAVGLAPQATLLVGATNSGIPRAAEAVIRLELADGIDAGDLEVRNLGGETATLTRQASGSRLDIGWREPRSTGGLTRLLIDSTGLSAGPLCLDRLGYETGGQSHVFEPDDLHRSLLLGRFLEAGSVAIRGTSREGSLMLGPGAFSISLPPGADRRFRTTLHNLSMSPARFSASAGERSWSLELAPGRGAPVEISLPANAETLALEAAGEPLGLFFLGAPTVSHDVSGHGPPVILITLDTCRRDAVAPWSDDPAATPNLAAFARRSTVYHRATAVSPWTVPAHASVFTGSYPSQHRAGLELDLLDPALVSIAEALRDAGWATTGIAGGPLASSRWGFSQGFQEFHEPAPGGELTASEVVDKAVTALDSAAAEPLLLFLNFFDPHLPYAAPEPHRAARRVPELLADHRDSEAYLDASGGWASVIQGGSGLSPPQRRLARLQYEAEVHYMDAELGRLFADLEARGLFDEAMIVVVSDHGELIGEQGLLGHSHRLDAELIDIPLIVKWPGQRRAEDSYELRSQADIPRMIAEATGIAWKQPRRPAALAPDSLLSEEHMSWVHELRPGMRLGRDVFALTDSHRRTILWEDGQQCFERVGNGWREATCSQREISTLAALSASLAPVERLPAGRTLELEKEASLRALGYLD